jgi:hypothetical protein
MYCLGATSNPKIVEIGTVARGIPLYGAACKTCSGYAGENPVVIGGPALKLTTF